jgi:glucosamine--fructose-6-phosphate aminotransferase (isomerizing)
MIEEYLDIPCLVDYASEFRYRHPVLDNATLLCISQSGETADTLAALKQVKENGNLTLGIVNVVGSTIARKTDAGVYNHIGPEIGVASTKAFTSQITILTLITLSIGQQLGKINKDNRKQILQAILKLPDQITQILDQNDQIEVLAEKYKDVTDFLYIGRKYNYPIAMEGALKLKEISYIHAEGYSAGEMKHGPIALIDKNFPTFGIIPTSPIYGKTYSNLEEIKARSGPILAVATQGDDQIKKLTEDVIYIPQTLDLLTPILSVIPLQLFAYHMAVLNNRDVDKPRNLAKSVTVE